MSEMLTKERKKKTKFGIEFEKWIDETGNGCGCGKCLIEMANSFYLLGREEEKSKNINTSKNLKGGIENGLQS